MAEHSRLYARQAERLKEGIRTLEDGAASFVFAGTTYTTADLTAKPTTLYDRYDWTLLKAAIEAIDAGDQSYTIAGGRSFTKADRKTLSAELDALEQKVARKGGVGVRVWYGVPTG